MSTSSIAHATSAATREQPLPEWFEEPHIVFAVRRVHLHLRKPDTLTLDQYESGRVALLGSVHGARREQLALLLPSGHQLARLADGDWNMILALCGLPAVATASRATAHPRVLLAWHYYEVNRRLPGSNDLPAYYRPLGIAVPSGVSPWSQVHEAVAAKRAERGWSTPPDGPPEDERLTSVELAELLEGAPKAIRPRGYWTTDTITDALIEYLDEFEGVVPLRQKHFMGVRVGREWPTWDAIRTQLVPGRGDVRWEEALTVARRERRRRRRAA